MELGRNRFTFETVAGNVVAAMLMADAALRARAQASAEDEVLNLQKKFQAATVSGDTAAIASAMADDAIFIHAWQRGGAE